VNKNMTLQQERALAELEKAFTSVGVRLRLVQAVAARRAADSEPQNQTPGAPSVFGRIRNSLLGKPKEKSDDDVDDDDAVTILQADAATLEDSWTEEKPNKGVIGDTLKEKIAWHLDYLGKKGLLLNLDLRGVSGFDPEKHKRLRVYS
jgi:hypothetical protein